MCIRDRLRGIRLRHFRLGRLGLLGGFCTLGSLRRLCGLHRGGLHLSLIHI